MKIRIIALIALLGFCGASTSRAMGDGSPEAVIADTFLVRPACFVATVIGSAVFVVALPFAAMSKSVDQTAETLVAKPARATFTRPLGDFSDMD